MTVTDAPTHELGHPGGIAPTFTATAGQGFMVEGLEANPDLMFPASAVVYDRMRREDGQVGAVRRAITNPLVAARRTLVGDDVRPEVLAFVTNELGLNVDKTRARRRREGIVYREHVREAILALWFGFLPFEQTYTVGPAAPGLEDPAAPGRLYAHLRKLAPRMPRTLEEIRVQRDGGLAGIVQTALPGSGDPRGTFIPVDRLVMYVSEKEGADWTGNSLLRSAYKHWLIKDALIRLGAQIVERNGMGIPIVEYDDPSKRSAALALAKSLRAGAEAGGAMPQGLKVNIVGVSGSTADELPRVKYHDEAIGRSLLAMFLNLGHDNGARSLGETFVNLFRDSGNTLLDWLDEVATEHVIRDLVELNYGPDEPYPVLVSESLTEQATAEALKALAEAGLITPDRDLEADVRRRYGLPAKPEPTEGAAVEDAAGSPVADVGIPALIDAGVITPDEGRQMLRLPGSAPGIPGAAPAVVADAGTVVELPGFTAAAAGDGDMVARLAALNERVLALRQGHGS